MNRFLAWGTITVIALAVFAFVVAAPVYTIVSYHNENTYVIKVTDKETKTSGDSSKYLIFGDDDKGNAKVFENTDAIFARKFNSSDLYAEIEIGKTYEFKTIGFRIPFMSSYENIMTIKEAH
ncbi:hypothetical protein QRX25_14855 [Bacillus sp. L381]|uniref:hypothetical protein n=1 Tax=Bacillus TaxID=1386 RepID=UPI001BA88DD6|nr:MULTISPECIES: hypothetical protein [Bacillus]MCR9040818.1 DUF1523 family protein [Bacillus velezensis]QUN08760.1 hypothetical protein KEF49_14650 [Bacillus amyloliquefaciens]QYM81832.1 DUF1523 family protein [Bacillus sp. 7D3]QZY10978.1 DUF1523 family protein [Bacillus amyloliquefaciens]WIX20880.1 hypothetical protein QRX25_14855 [Bacillus sp. L381]